MGPVISAPHKQRIIDFIDGGEAEGAALLVDGRGLVVDGYPDGHWIGPTDLRAGHAFDEARVPRRSSARWPASHAPPNIDEAIALMHQVEHGNATSIFTTSGKAAREFRHRAGISMIGVNVGVAAPMAFFPFGGARGSFYRPHSLS